MHSLHHLRRNYERSTEGVWRDMHTGEHLAAPAEGHVCLLIAEARNPVYRDAIHKHRLRRLVALRAAQNGQLEALQREIEDEAIADGILRGWANLVDEKGEPVPYTRDKALEFLRDKSLWQFRDIVRDLAELDSSYRQQEEQAALGN